jgi:YesN/AraC family two-component response regulator
LTTTRSSEKGIAALIAHQKDMRLVGEASNGREAIEQLRSHRPDVTLMDSLMPEMNGIERCRVSDLNFFDSSAALQAAKRYTWDYPPP